MNMYKYLEKKVQLGKVFQQQATMTLNQCKSVFGDPTKNSY